MLKHQESQNLTAAVPDGIEQVCVLQLARHIVVQGLFACMLLHALRQL